MATTDFGGIIAIAKGETISLLAVYHSSDFTNGGDYLGPSAFLGAPVESFQVITTVETGVQLTVDNSDITRKAIYTVKLRNDGDRDNSFGLQSFHP